MLTVQTPPPAPGNFDCLTCHELVWDGSSYVFAVFKDCLLCHYQRAFQASVHHLTQAAETLNCRACHGPIDNPDDGHFIPTGNAPYGPLPGFGPGPNGSGGCAFCHDTPDRINPGLDSASGVLVYSNADTHHSTGVALGPFTEENKLIDPKCNLCHEVLSAPIKSCEKCHASSSLHNIQEHRDNCIGCHTIVINSATCSNGVVTITGSGFSEYVNAVNSGTSVQLGANACSVNSWSDTHIVANCGTCSGTVQVSSVFGTASKTVVDLTPKPCSYVYSDWSECQPDNTQTRIYTKSPDGCIENPPPVLTQACDSDPDGDGVANESDNCKYIANSNQYDWNNDGEGDVCDPDVDGDGVLNNADLCAFTTLGTIVDPSNGCSIDQLNPCQGPRGTTVPWKNHGQYVSSVAKTANSFLAQGLITQAQKDTIVSAAASSNCGQK